MPFKKSIPENKEFIKKSKQLIPQTSESQELKPDSPMYQPWND
jgi:hypothetical protein